MYSVFYSNMPDRKIR